MVPHYVDGKNIDDTKDELDAALRDLDCSFYISFKTNIKDIVNARGNIYNSVILVGKFA